MASAAILGRNHGARLVEDDAAVRLRRVVRLDVHEYKFVPPTALPPADWLERLQGVVVERREIKAVYLVGEVYETEEGTLVQDTVHVELNKPPAWAAAPEQFYELFVGFPGNGPGFTITPQRLLPAVRAAGTLLI